LIKIITVKKFEIASSTSGKSEPDVLQGKGKELGDIDNVEKALGKAKATDPVITKLYTILYPGAARVKVTSSINNFIYGSLMLCSIGVVQLIAQHQEIHSSIQWFRW
jgi:hypothetical protein